MTVYPRSLSWTSGDEVLPSNATMDESGDRKLFARSSHKTLLQQLKVVFYISILHLYVMNFFVLMECPLAQPLFLIPSFMFKISLFCKCWVTALGCSSQISYLVKGKVPLKALVCRTCSVLQKPRTVISKCFPWNFQANQPLGSWEMLPGATRLRCWSFMPEDKEVLGQYNRRFYIHAPISTSISKVKLPLEII